MSMTDPISDMLARIRNAQMADKDDVEIPLSRLKVAIAEILQQEGYIDGFEVHGDEPHRSIRLHLRYGEDRSHTITGLKRVSRPGLRVYSKANELPKVLGGMGTAIVSTSAGVMTDRKARREKLGGEVMAFIW